MKSKTSAIAFTALAAASLFAATAPSALSEPGPADQAVYAVQAQAAHAYRTSRQRTAARVETQTPRLVHFTPSPMYRLAARPVPNANALTERPAIAVNTTGTAMVTRAARLQVLAGR